MHVANPYSRLSRTTILLAIATLATLFSLTFFVSTSQAWTYDYCIALNPPTATNQLPQQSSHTVTATVTQGSVDHGWRPVCPGASPYVGTTVTFTVTGGPNAGKTGTGVTDVNGNATFTYSGSVAGTDTIEAVVNDTWDWTCDFVNNEAACDNSMPPAAPWVHSDTLVTYPVVARAQKTWLPPVPPTILPPPTTVHAAGTPVPAARITVSKRCQHRKFKIRSSYSHSAVKRITIKIDGKTYHAKSSHKKHSKSHKSGSQMFTIDSSKYKNGWHRIVITTTFKNGTRVIKNAKFRRCTVRTSQRRISPKFTG